MRRFWLLLRPFLGLLLVSALALELYFLGRIALMRWIDPQSTTFERSEVVRLLGEERHLAWKQQWVDYPRLALPLKRAVVASEDSGFAEHSGVEWDALEKAWERNQKAEALQERLQDRSQSRSAPVTAPARAASKLVGGSTITQQLAKNLFLSSERNFVRKSQEFLITAGLEALLDKRRILEIYLNHVEWGAGVFGAQAAAQHYFRVSASDLSTPQAARLAVMLPAPKRFERRPASAYVLSRASSVMARMGAVEVP